MKIKKFILIPVLALIVSVCSSVPVLAQSYIYNSEQEAVASPDAYILSQEITLEAEGKVAVLPQDICVSPSGRIYVVDTNNHRVLVYDNEYEQVSVLSEFTLADGTKTTLKKPEGIYVDANETIYIADTENNRIIECDGQGNVSNVVENLKNFVGSNLSFKPTKVVVNKAGRLYVVAKSNNQGILQVERDSEFIGYIGAPKVQYSLVEMMWRKFSTQAQLDKMMQFVPTEFNNIAMDEEEFVFATISALEASKVEQTIKTKDVSGNVTPIKKLNVVGDDILKRNGEVAPMGDLEYQNSYSKIVDVASTSGGVYAMLDATEGRVFIYDYNGNLLCMYGNDEFSQVSSIAYEGENMVILDAVNAKMYVYRLTEYGNLLMKAASAQYIGDFEASYSAWSDVVAYNYNFEYAFIGFGQSYMEEGRYEEAMACFLKADDKDRYSDAKELLRKENMKTSFPIIVVSIICVAVLALVVSLTKQFIGYVNTLKRRES